MSPDPETSSPAARPAGAPRRGAARGGRTVVIGGGPAGLTAAYELQKLGLPSLVLEGGRDVGGISRTCEHAGYRFDIGGHRFFTKVDYVQQLWEEILGEEFLTRPRLSRIHYRGRLFDYPLRPLNALRGLGLAEALRVVASYLRARVLPIRDERSFEDWVVNRFGRRLYEIFFRTYTEKVWGMPCTEISPEWAAQRIKNLDLLRALSNAFLGPRGAGGDQVTSLIEEFRYPRLGPGQLWNRCAELLEGGGNEVRRGARVVRVHHDGRRVRSLTVRDRDGQEEEVPGQHFLSSTSLRELFEMFDPAPPPEVLEAARSLRYRDFVTVALVLDEPELFPDNWIYVHSGEVQVGRIQNFKNWSPDLVPDPAHTTLGLEYFVHEGDGTWSRSDEELLRLAREELSVLGLARGAPVLDGTVLRVRKAYPVYDEGYAEAVDTLRAWSGRLANLQLIGRNGQHRYNNQDHSMMTGVLAARNIAGEDHDVWAVNVESEYHEERGGEEHGATHGVRGGERLVPRRLGRATGAVDSPG